MPKASVTINARGLNRDLRDDLETALAPLAADIAILIEDGEPLVAPDLSAAPTTSRAARLVARGCALIARGRFHLKHSSVIASVGHHKIEAKIFRDFPCG